MNVLQTCASGHPGRRAIVQVAFLFKELVVMRFRKLALFISAVSAISTGLLVVACSSDTTTPVPTPTVDAAKGSSGSSGTSSGSSGTSGSSGGDDTGAPDAGADCSKPPTLHPGDAGIYCPFSAVGDAGNVYCAETEKCCETPSGTSPSTCVAKADPCTVANSTVWECEQPSDCPTGEICCAASSTAGTAVTIATDVCGPYLSKFSTTKCETACATGELTVCEEQTHCTTGTCTAVKPKANAIGVCK